jgi:hypothetical protein
MKPQDQLVTDCKARERNILASSREAIRTTRERVDRHRDPAAKKKIHMPIEPDPKKN